MRSTPSSLSPAWRGTLLALGGALAGILLVFRSPIADAVSLWWNISSYNHAFLILPISLLLVSEKKDQLKYLDPTPCYWGLLGVVGFALIWLGSYAADVSEGQHFAILGMIEALLLTVLGTAVFRMLLFPILYLWLLVPTGTFLLPTLQWIATLQVEGLLNISGIPVFTQNTLIEVPSGLYTVAPGCAGLNFIFTTLALAPLYTYYMYQSLTKRLNAIGIMIIVAIMANAFRIFAIIALAEFTNRRIDIVDDHLLYGWGFFALILLAMAALGWRYADPENHSRAPLPLSQYTLQTGDQIKGFAKKPTLAATLALLIAIFPAAYVAARERPELAGHITLSVPDTVGTWRQTQSETNWMPSYPYAHGMIFKQYKSEQCCVDLYIAYYQNQTKVREVVAIENRLADPSLWQSVDSRRHTIILPGAPSTISATTLISGAQQRLVWHWYWVDGQFTSNPLLAKLLEAKANLMWGESRAAAIILSTKIRTNKREAAVRLHNFLESDPDINLMLKQAQWAPQAAAPE